MRIVTLIKRLLPLAALLILCIFFNQKTDHKFLTAENGFAIANQYAYLLIIGIGSTVVIVAGGIDLSGGSVLAISGIVTAEMMVNRHIGIVPACLIGVATGAVCGIVNGLAITKLRVPAFIATLGMLLVARGLALRIAKGVTIDNTPEGFNYLANGKLLNLPVPLWIIAAVAILVTCLLKFTKFGRYVYAIGSNAEAARVSGVNVPLVQIGVYALAGALSGLAGLVETARLGSGNPTGGDGYELDVVTAVVIGGASLLGGEGTVGGTILGALLIAALRNGSNLIGVDPFDQKIYIGVLIIAAVAFDQKLRRMK